jgi:hypothetical protein
MTANNFENAKQYDILSKMLYSAYDNLDEIAKDFEALQSVHPLLKKQVVETLEKSLIDQVYGNKHGSWQDNILPGQRKIETALYNIKALYSKPLRADWVKSIQTMCLKFQGVAKIKGDEADPLTKAIVQELSKLSDKDFKSLRKLKRVEAKAYAKAAPLNVGARNTSSQADIYANDRAAVDAAEAEARAMTGFEIGDTMADGTILAGISPDTNKPLYAAPSDAPSLVQFNEAAQYAANLKIGDKKDFRVPSEAELLVLYMNRNKGALKGTFNQTALAHGNTYWASTPVGITMSIQSFADGEQCSSRLENPISVRCVR